MIFAVAIELTAEIIFGILGTLVAGGSLAGVWHVMQFRIKAQDDRMKEDRSKFADALIVMNAQITALQGGERQQSERSAVIEEKLNSVIKALNRIEAILDQSRSSPHGNE
jgi:hypothetical protein